MKEQLRKAEDQIQASKQEAVLMSKELSDAVNVRDKTMADLHSARLENEKFKKQLAEALAELKKITALKNEQVDCQYLVLKFIYKTFPEALLKMGNKIGFWMIRANNYQILIQHSIYYLKSSAC